MISTPAIANGQGYSPVYVLKKHSLRRDDAEPQLVVDGVWLSLPDGRQQSGRKYDGKVLSWTTVARRRGCHEAYYGPW